MSAIVFKGTATPITGGIRSKLSKGRGRGTTAFERRICVHNLARRRRTLESIPGLILSEEFTLPAGAKLSLQREGYVRIAPADIGTDTRKWPMLHRYIWELANDSIPDGYVIYHVNGNSLDNRIENLEPMSKAEHSRLHRLHPELASQLGAEHYAKNRERERWRNKCKHARKKGLPVPPRPWEQDAPDESTEPIAEEVKASAIVPRPAYQPVPDPDETVRMVEEYLAAERERKEQQKDCSAVPVCAMAYS